MGQAEEQKTSGAEQTAMYEKALSFANAGISACEAEKDDLTAQSIIRLRQGIWNSLAYAYAERGEYLGVAEEYISSALKAEPANPNYLDTKAWILIRTAELSKDVPPSQRQKMFADSEALLNQAIAFYSEKDTEAKAETFYHMGHKEKLQGRMDKARELFLKALQLDPGHEKAKKEMM